MKTKWYALGILAVIGFVIGGILINRQQPAPTVSTPKQVARVVEAPPAPSVAPETQPMVETVAPEPVKEPSVKPVAPKQSTAQNQPQKQPKEPLHDPDAREALALVGVDPEAEQYWLNAIFDTSLPDNEREDLMEDLNEVGFEDLKNLTPDDVALIERRLQILQDLVPYADPFMMPHLWEPYKDLTNMLAKVP